MLIYFFRQAHVLSRNKTEVKNHQTDSSKFCYTLISQITNQDYQKYSIQQINENRLELIDNKFLRLFDQSIWLKHFPCRYITPSAPSPSDIRGPSILSRPYNYQ